MKTFCTTRTTDAAANQSVLVKKLFELGSQYAGVSDE